MPESPDFSLRLEPPVALMDALYDDLVRVRVASRAFVMARDWLGAKAVDLVDATALAPGCDHPALSASAATDGESADQAPMLVGRWRCIDDLTETRRGQFACLARHVGRARAFRSRLVESRRMGEVFNSGLDRLSIGVLNIFPDGRPIAANRIACELLNEGDGISLAGGRLCFASPGDQRAFRDLCEMALDEVVEQGCLRVSRPSGKADLTLLVLRPPPRPGVMRSGLRLLLRDPEQHTVRSRNALRDLYGLTDSEAAITMHLANGLCAEEVEEQFAIRHNTMRAHLRSIYAKLGVSSHAELVHAILTGASALARENHDELPPLEPLTSLVQ
ncbi:helix-turn-helix transcriptional regulator [Novosphingobium naphthalenivorans]|uniref:helix-turn-helix transcriptional regulator n=1 Tax=Novosphingobium naphthalenivorans TaxID=273168 RepID=UPI000837263A|nr:helix-turn-helix transcriptional regulator [Novosphingobium naphthalenivorans]